MFWFNRKVLFLVVRSLLLPSFHFRPKIALPFACQANGNLPFAASVFIHVFYVIRAWWSRRCKMRRCSTVAQGGLAALGPAQSCKSGLKFAKMFRVVFAPAYKTFFDFFLSWSTFVVLTAMTSVSEVIVTFLQANSICKHSYVLLFSARISLTFLLRRRQRWGN